MSLIPGSLPSGTCYGTPQELLDLFAQYLDIPAFAVSTKVLYSGTSPMPNTDFVWVDTSGATTPTLKIYNEISGDYQEYPFSGQLSPAGAETLISGKSAITTLSTSDYFLVSQAGTSAVLKKISWGDLVGQVPANTITFPMLSTSATESNNVTKRTAAAWVNFNGTGTVAIRSPDGSFNVTSITDNAGNGDYTINFTSAFANANYAVVLTVSRESGETALRSANIKESGMSSSTCRIVTGSSTLEDRTYVTAAFFGVLA